MIISIIIAVFIGFAWVSGSKNPVESSADSGKRLTHIIGKQDSKVTLVEYSDFQCPACGAYYPIVEQVVEKYKDRVNFEYRQYPLATIHHNAFAAARASEAASKQGKFWEMYRLLFADQSAWENSGNAQSTFEGYARQLGLDRARFKTDFASSETTA